MFILILSFFSSAFAIDSSSVASDPRNQPGYSMLFDMGSTSKAAIADGYGGYLQHYISDAGKEVFRFCDNFEGKGLKGRPNLSKKRSIFVPYGTVDPQAYLCHDYTPSDVAAGRKIIFIGEKSFFALKSEGWEKNSGGTLLFQIAKKVPLIGSPTYKNIRLRANRAGGKWRVEMVVPKGETIVANWLQFVATASGLGVPNGVNAFTLNPGTRLERSFDIDTLEDVQ